MTTSLTVIILIIGIVSIKALINGYKVWRLTSLEKQYHTFMRNLAAGRATPDFLEKTPEIIDLFKKAGQKSSTLTRVEPVGFGLANPIQIDVFDNIATNDEQVYGITTTIFKKAIGTFKMNIYDSFNPLYWIEFLIYLPQNIINYVLGDKAIPNWCVRLINVIYWLAGVVGAVIKILNYFN